MRVTGIYWGLSPARVFLLQVTTSHGHQLLSLRPKEMKYTPEGISVHFHESDGTFLCRGYPKKHLKT